MTPGWRRLGSWALALGLGTAGGFLFNALHLPLAWMLGAMTANTLAALCGLKPAVPRPLRNVMIAVLGLMLGSAFTPAIAAQAGNWLPSLLSLALYVAVTTILVMTYFRKGPRYGPVTAYFAAAPGGLNEMTLMGAAMGGDDRTISLTHAMRVLLIVMVIPFWFRLTQGYHSQGTAKVMGSLIDLSAQDAAFLAASAIAGSLIGKLLRVPAATLTGPMIASGILHIAGLTQSHPPGELVNVAQVVMGSAIGSRFSGLKLGYMGQTFLTAIGSTAIMLVVSVAFTEGLAYATGLPFAALLLAFVPGGLAEMSLIAVSLGIDIAFVSTHHFARIVLVIMLAPLTFRLVRHWWGGAEQPAE